MAGDKDRFKAATPEGMPQIIKYDGICDIDGLYKLIQQWFVDQGFYFEEPTIKHKVPSPAGAEQDQDMRGWRNVNEYVRFNLKVYLKIRDLKEIEVIKEGKKKRLSKCRLRIYIAGDIELDWQGKFDKSPFLQQLKKFYNKYIIKEDEGIIGGVWWDQLYYRMFKLTTIIKEFLDMESKGNAYYDMW